MVLILVGDAVVQVRQRAAGAVRVNHVVSEVHVEASISLDVKADAVQGVGADVVLLDVNGRQAAATVEGRDVDTVATDATSQRVTIVEDVVAEDRHALNDGVVTAVEVDAVATVVGNCITADHQVGEAGFFRDDSYMKLKPALLERQGKLIVIGVPELKNFYYKLYKESKKNNSKVFSLQLPSIVNPNISIEEWHELYRTTPRQEFLRQYCARFIEDHSSVWKIKDIENLKGGEIEEPKEENIYLAGLDLARKSDYTVLTILVPVTNGKLQIVFRIKLNNIGWSNQAEIIAHHLNRYNVQACVVDATGIGDSVIEQLANKTTSGLEAFIFTNESKANLIDSLSLQIESKKILIPETFEEYFIELGLFEIIKSKEKGLRVFQAPEGYHDDHVISLALANRAYQFHYYA